MSNGKIKKTVKAKLFVWMEKPNKDEDIKAHGVWVHPDDVQSRQKEGYKKADKVKTTKKPE